MTETLELETPTYTGKNAPKIEAAPIYHAKHDRTPVELQNKLGLHSRAANLFVKQAMGYESEIGLINGVSAEELSRDGLYSTVDIHGKKYMDGKSIMSILMIAAEKGTKLELAAEGEDCHKAIHELSDLIMNRKFDEE